MSTLRKIVYNSVIAIHRRTGKEWIPLKEIYDEVDKRRDVGINNGGASISTVLETHSILSKAFSGTEEYILKEKGSGLYKSVYYDQIKFINNMNIGDVFTRDQLMSIFKISGMAGIMKTNTLDCLVLTTDLENGVYDDSTIENGFITYTGEGLIGDQTITKNNKAIYYSNDDDLPMYLFSKDSNRKYTFEGKVKLCDKPYQVNEKDIKGNQRLVWKFPLQIVEQEDQIFENDESFNRIVYQIAEIENKLYSDASVETNSLVLKEGKINIRKYGKDDRKYTRTNKPDYIAEEIIKNNQGIINEKRVFENEIERLMKAEAYEQVKKMEDFFNNKKENEGFDVLSFELNEDGEYVEKYIEVKSTKGNEGTPIDITSDEIDFAKKNIDNYYLYRIIKSDSEDRSLKIVKGKDLFNDIDYDFIPTSYRIYSK